MSMPPLVMFSRADWGAWHGRGTETEGPKELVVFHHFWRPHINAGVTLQKERETVRNVEEFHTQERGWQGIAYNFVIFQSGHAYVGRGWGRVGAHCKGHNADSVGIAFAIDGDEHRLTPAAQEACRNLLTEGIRHGHVAPDFVIKGHCDYSEKSCPGRLVYPILEELRPKETHNA